MTVSFSHARRNASFALAVACASLAIAGYPARTQAAVPAAQRAILTRFLDALHAQKYDAAYALLSKPERAYFGNAGNYASSYLADRSKLDSYKLVTTTQTSAGTVAVVSETLEVFSHKLQTTGAVTAKFAYGIVNVDGALGIKDPYHPWRAIAPQHWTATASGVTAIVRKLSFYTGRIELLLTFQNRGDGTVTLLPYGRSVVRDDASNVHQPIETKLAGLTDAELYKGVLLAPGAQYTGAMTFFTSNRFTPRSLSATLAPLLTDGADAPFELDLPDFPVSR